MKSSTNIVKLSLGRGHITEDGYPRARSTRLFPTLGRWLADVFRHSFKFWRSQYLVDATISDLQRLDDRLLKDIGIERDQIELFVAKRLHSGRFANNEPGTRGN